MDYSSVYSISGPDGKDQFIDYLGICVWDHQRLSWVAPGSGFYARNSQVSAWTFAQNRAWSRSGDIL
jgi:hypothetical protein